MQDFVSKSWIVIFFPKITILIKTSILNGNICHFCPAHCDLVVGILYAATCVCWRRRCVKRSNEGLAWYINWKATPIPVSSCQFSFAQERRTIFFFKFCRLFYLFINHVFFGGECVIGYSNYTIVLTITISAMQLWLMWVIWFFQLKIFWKLRD